MDTEEFGETLVKVVSDRKAFRAFFGIERLNELAKEFYNGIEEQHQKNLKECEDKVDKFLTEEGKI